MTQQARRREKSQRFGDHTICRNQHRFQLRFETLEQRHLLAIFTVDSPLDVVDSGDGVLTLREAVQAANAIPGADTIEFDPSLTGSTVLLTNGEIMISDAATVNGLGSGSLTVSGNNQSRVFHVTDFGPLGDVIIRGLAIIDGDTAGDGGGVIAYRSVTIEDCSISGNTAGGNGGGVAVISNPTGDPAIVTIQNSIISGNVSGGDGGGLYSAAELTINGSTVSGNHTAGYFYSGSGGGIFSSGRLNISSSTISGNGTNSAYTTAGSGGGIAATGDLTIHDCIISGNSAGDGQSKGGDGGGIWATEMVLISGSQVSNNSAGSVTLPLFNGQCGNGGGVFAGNFALIVDTTVSDNSAGSATGLLGQANGGDGGGIWGANVTITRSTISHNSAGGGSSGGPDPINGGNGGNGGGIYGDSVLIEESFVLSNVAGSGGGGGNPGGDGGSGGSGGGVQGGSIEITGSQISDNVAGIGGGGGAGFDGGGQTNGTPGGNGGYGGDGGGVLGNTVTLLDTTVSGNFAGAGGAGGEGGPGGHNLDQGFSGGRGAFGGLGGNGGGMSSNSVFITGCALFSNSAGSGGRGGAGGRGGYGSSYGGSGGNGGAGGQGGNGGAIFAGEATISASTISGNYAGNGSIGGFGGNGSTGLYMNGDGGAGGRGGDGGSGGAIYSQTASIVDAWVNQGVAGAGGAGGNGGAGVIGGDAGVGGNGGSGGGIFARVTADRTTVSNSHAGAAGPGGTGGVGGGITGIVTIGDSTISGNSSPHQGGGIWSNGTFTGTDSSRISNSTISGNSTSGSGGGVFNNAGLLFVQFSTITDNSAPPSHGSGIASYDDVAARTEITSSIIAGNVGTDIDELAGFSLTSLISGGYNLVGTGNGVPAFNNNDLIGITDPGLFPLANYGGPTETHALMLSSPAIDAGDPAAVAGVGDVPRLDQRGFKRVGNGRIDIGAVELDYSQSCDFPAPGGLLGDGYSDLIYNEITGILSLRMDTDLFPGDGITGLLIEGPQPLAAATGAPAWQTSVYAGGVMQLAMPDTPPGTGIEINVPLLQYDAGLQPTEIGCIEYYTINGFRTFTRVYFTTDTEPPVASLTPPVIGAGTPSSEFEVTYTDNTAVLGDSLGGDTLLVTGPNGYSEIAQLIVANPAIGSHPVIEATYSIPAPGGLWDGDDIGQYTIEALPFTVADTELNFLTAGQLGTFDFGDNCDFPVPSGVLGDGYSDLIYNEVTGILSLRIDTNQFPDNGIIELSIEGPEPLRAAAGSPIWQSSVYANGAIQLSMPGTTPGVGVETNVPLLDYSSGLQSTDFGCVEYLTVGGLQIYSRVYITPDTTAPTVIVTAPEVVLGTPSTEFEVVYSDDVAVLADSLVGDTILVTGPNGYSEVATQVAINPPSGNSAVIQATYSIPAPGGAWNGQDVGQYGIELLPFIVSDLDVNFAQGGLLGNFVVDARIHLTSLLASQGGDGSAGFVVNGTGINDNAGRWVSFIGDLNDDDYDDFLVTATGADVNGNNSGGAYVVYGRDAGFPAEIDAGGLSGTDGFIVHGAAAGDSLGIIASGIGDVNYDGLHDFAITSLSHDGPAGSNTGAIYVVYGSTVAPANPLDVGLLDGSNGFTIYGLNAQDNLSAVDAAGDVNGDGIDDFVLGAWVASPDDRTRAGQAYVVFGQNGGFPAVYDLASLNGINGFSINGAVSDDRLGHKVSAAGDIDGDGYGELLVAAINADVPGADDVGKTYVLFGKPHGFPAVMDTATLSADEGITLAGLAAGDFSSTRIDTAGDINGDGLSDLIITAYQADGGMGEAYVVFGAGRASLSTVSLSNLDGTNGFRIPGVIADQQLGLGVRGGGDVNGDGLGDVVIGAPNTSVGGDTTIGRAYVVFGNSTGFGPTIDVEYMSFAEGITLAGAFPGDRTGTSVGIAGDINGDGYDDLLVGASNADPQGMSNAGRAYLLFGRDFSELVTHEGSPGTDAIPGTSGPDIIVAGNGNDVLGGVGGADVLKGARGNDQLLVLDSSFLRIMGGRGNDRLGVTGAGQTLDLTALSNLRVSDIEEIDLAGTGVNSLILTRLDVLNLSRESNELLVDGNPGDSVDLGSQWIRNGTEVIGVQTYDVFVSGNAVVKVSQNVSATVQLAGDFNADGQFNCDDVDSLVAAIAAGQYSAQYDLTFDSVLDMADLMEWLVIAGAETLPSGAPYLVGDANLNGVVDGSDFNIWNANKFTSVAAWCSGDFNADGLVDGSDFNLWNGNKFQASDTLPRPDARPGQTVAAGRDWISPVFATDHAVGVVLHPTTAVTREPWGPNSFRSRLDWHGSPAESNREVLFARDLDDMLAPWQFAR